MILLVASRLTMEGRYSYTISRRGQLPHFAAEDLAETADELRRLGVGDESALYFIAHARIWGSVEIVETGS